MNGAPIPSNPAELTAEWLTAALREGGLPKTTGVSAFSTQVIGQDWGFTGVVARVRLQFERGDDALPRSIVAKFPMASGESTSLYQRASDRDDASRQRAYERASREVHFYQDLAGDGTAPVPALYFGAADDDAQRVVLLLEDLAGGRSGDVLRGCSSGEVGAVLASVALIHAHHWQRNELDTPGWLPRWGRDLTARAQRYTRSLEPFLARFGARLPPGGRDLLESLARSYVPALSELHSAPLTVIHGDLHLDNVIFDPAETGAAWIIDWQGVMAGPVALDLAFIANSLSVDERRMSEDRLLTTYHAHLVSRGAGDYALGQLKREYLLALFANLAGTVIWLGSSDLTGLEGRERAMIEAIVEQPKPLLALLDHGGTELLPR